jgi:ribosomal protein S12 methylthiotransferase
MRRGNTVRDVADLPQRVRGRLPGVVLRTTCLVGHPGETAAAFAHLKRYVREAAFDHLGVFAFSPEEQTPSEHMKPRPGAAVAARRREELLDLQQTVLDAGAPAWIGAEDAFLVEQAPSGRGATSAGRTRRQAPEVDGKTLAAGLPGNVKPGSWCQIRYKSRQGADWLATAV